MEASGARVVLDSSAVIALLRDEPAAASVERLLREPRARMSTVNAAETVDVLVRVHGRTVDEVVAAVEDLFAAGVEPVPPSFELALRAGELRARRFERRNLRLSLADSFVLATAGDGGALVTCDAALAKAARDAGVEAVLLPT